MTPRASLPRVLRAVQRGLSLVELMVAMAIGLVVVLAITSLIVVSQTQERTTGGSNDMNQSSAYATTVIDQALRSAGAGFAQDLHKARAPGCLPHVSRTSDGSTTVLLPRGSALPAPFAALLGGATGTANLRMAPLLIGQGESAGGSDILVVMSGTGSIGDSARSVNDIAVDGSTLTLDTALAINKGDLLLLTGGLDTENCVVVQVSNSFTPSGTTGLVQLAGAYHRTTVDGTLALNSLVDTDPTNPTAEAHVTGLGNPASGSLAMQLFGVGTDRVLYRYDLLQQTGNDAAEAVAEGVVALRAIYSVDENIDDSIADPDPTWTEPTGDYAIEALLDEDKSPADRALALRRIVGVRVSLLLRSNTRQAQTAARETYVMLEGLPGEQEVELTDAERHYAHRLIEVTIPLRNMLMAQPAQQ